MRYEEHKIEVINFGDIDAFVIVGASDDTGTVDKPTSAGNSSDM